jgi:hypothetical protein
VSALCFHISFYIYCFLGGVKKDGITCVFNFGDDTWGTGPSTEEVGGACEDEAAGGGLFAALGMFDEEEE